MWEKIKSFFQNKVTKVLSWVILALAVVSLIIGGATTESITSAIALMAGIVAAVAALIAFIADHSK